MNDKQVMHALSVDDAYVVQRVLARGEGGVTELVVAGGEGPFVRKKMTRGLVRRCVWSALLDCDCPRLPHIENIYQMPDEFVVVYDFIPGKSLRELVAERGRLPESEVISLGLDLCEAAGAVHELGIIHRDITPKNVVVSGDGAHLIDFGIARMYTEGASRDTNTLGTYGFASPEQYGFEQTDARSDVYSIGRVLGYLLTGIMPNDEGYREALLDESVVSDQMRAIVEHACAMEPSARYQSAAEFAAALRGEKNAEAAGDEAGDKAVAETAAAAGARPARRGAVIFQRSGYQNRSKRQKNDGTPGGNVTAARTSRRPKWVVVLAEAMVALAMVATLLVFLARNGVIPQWGAALRRLGALVTSPVPATPRQMSRRAPSQRLATPITTMLPVTSSRLTTSLGATAPAGSTQRTRSPTRVTTSSSACPRQPPLLVMPAATWSGRPGVYSHMSSQVRRYGMRLR